MRSSNRKSAVFATIICGSAISLSALATPTRSQSTAVAAPGVESQEIVLVLDTTHCKVHYTVDSSLHTVHGTFNLKSGTVHFDPHSGKAGGEVVVFATSGESGNSSRDARMHKEILESPKYPDVVFRPTQVEGKMARDGNSDVRLHGVMLLHGQQHEIVVPVHAQLTADRWTGTASFPVPYIEWGLKDPSNWLLKVKPVVNIELEMAGSANGQK
jgi:polyisoprenoid-binding protein YceI